MTKLTEKQIKDLCDRLESYGATSDLMGSYTESQCAYDAAEALSLLFQEVKQYRGDNQ
jgi:hypothetical protein